MLSLQGLISMMLRHAHAGIRRWLVAFLLALSFVLPYAHVIHAADMSMEDMSSMAEEACADGTCEMPREQRACLELCLQMAVTDEQVATVFAVSVSVLPKLAGDEPIFLPHDVFTAAQAIEPPNKIALHLTTQKRE